MTQHATAAGFDSVEMRLPVEQLQVFHAVDHFFRRNSANETSQSTNCLADGAALIRYDNDASVADPLLEILAMEPREVAYVERINASPLLDRKGELILICGSATIRLDSGQDVHATNPESLDDGVLSSIFVHIQTPLAHETVSGGAP
ncbi:MAG: hypothetical protein WBF93_18400 [Pirellulales bacterium]